MSSSGGAIDLKVFKGCSSMVEKTCAKTTVSLFVEVVDAFVPILAKLHIFLVHQLHPEDFGF